MFLKKQKKLIGLDIGSQAIKLVELEYAKGSFRLNKLGVISLDPNLFNSESEENTEQIVAAIKDLIKSQEIETKLVATSLPGNAVITRKLSVPAMSSEEYWQTIQWTAAEHIPFDISEVNLDFQILAHNKGEENMDVLLVAAKKDLVDKRLDILREAGLTPVIMDTDCFAVQNMFETNYQPDPSDHIALINIGARATNLNIIQNGRPVFLREIEVGGDQFNMELQNALGLDRTGVEKIKGGEIIDEIGKDAAEKAILKAAENITSEILQSLTFFRNNNDLGQEDLSIYITGGLSTISSIRTALEKKSSCKVEIVDVLKNIIVDESVFDQHYIQAIEPFLPVALGLAIRQIG